MIPLQFSTFYLNLKIMLSTKYTLSNTPQLKKHVT